MTTWREVQIIHEAHPDWGSTRIAEVLECHSGYVRATAQRRKWKLGRDPYPTRIDRDVILAGYRARLSRAEIAEKVGCSATYVSDIVAGLRASGIAVPDLRAGPRAK